MKDDGSNPAYLFLVTLSMPPSASASIIGTHKMEVVFHIVSGSERCVYSNDKKKLIHALLTGAIARVIFVTLRLTRWVVLVSRGGISDGGF